MGAQAAVLNARLRAIDPDTLISIVTLSIASQALVYGGFVFYSLRFCAHDPLKLPVSEYMRNHQIVGGPSYLNTVAERILYKACPLFGVALAHQVISLVLFFDVVRRQRAALLTVCFFWLSCVTYSAVSFRLPAKVMAFSQEVYSGNEQAFREARTLMQDSKKELIGESLGCAAGTIAMLLAILSSLEKKQSPKYYWLYGISSFLFLLPFSREARISR